MICKTELTEALNNVKKKFNKALNQNTISNRENYEEACRELNIIMETCYSILESFDMQEEYEINEQDHYSRF